MNTELSELVQRTRPTIVDILRDRGYDVAAYENTAPTELAKLMTTDIDLLTMVVNRKDKPDERCIVLYWIENRVRMNLERRYLPTLYNTEETQFGGKPLDYEKDEVIVILNEPFQDVFTQVASKWWQMHRARLSFFQIKQLIINPAKHILVPSHRKLTEEETTEVLKKLFVQTRYKLPQIKYHGDIQARVIGLVPGDVVEITRVSKTAGESLFYRVCIP